MAKGGGLALLGGFVLCGASLARGETLVCTAVAALPATLATPGVYCLTGTLSTAVLSGTAITISADNVTLDMNGWSLDGLAAGSATWARGIYATGRNVTVRNGTIRGFYTGADLRGPGSRIEDVLLDRNTNVAIQIGGLGSVVRRNQIVATGGSTAAASRAAMAISVRAAASLVDDNLISGLTATGSGGEYGIYVLYADNVTVRGNTVLDDARPAAESRSYGVSVWNSSAASLVENSVTNFQWGMRYSLATGTYSRNVVVSCDTNYTDGTAGSIND